VAVTLAAVVVVTAAAFTVKVAELDPAGTRTEAGVVRLPLLSDSDAVAPPLGAGPVRVTVQAAVAGVTRVAGLQAREAIAASGGAAVTETVTCAVAEPELLVAVRV
jgi:hypothetical protein